jgi:hypothetical protein
MMVLSIPFVHTITPQHPYTAHLALNINKNTRNSRTMVCKGLPPEARNLQPVAQP